VSTRRVAISAVIAAGALALAVGVATARIESHSKSTTIAGGASRGATAKCPQGSEAVAGGFAAPGFDPTYDGRSILDFTSKRVGDRRWKTRGHNFSENGTPGKLISFAYCDTEQPGLSFRSEIVSLPAGSPGSATAKCPHGTEAVSGGFRSPDAGGGERQVFGVASKRVGDREWKVFAYNNDDGHRQRLVAFAECDRHQPGLRTESKSVKVRLVRKRSATANCGHGHKAFSGGFGARVNGNGSGPFPFKSKRTKRGWRAAAVGSGAGAHPFTVFAYCKP
jgi:hypothetical protein